MPDTLKINYSIQWSEGIYRGSVLSNLPVGHGKWKRENGDWLKGLWRINPSYIHES